MLDTNVLVSAGINSEGAPAATPMDWVLEGQVQLVTSPSVVAGYSEVVRRSKFARNGFPPLWLDFVIEVSLKLAEPELWPLACPNPKDAPILALAQASGAWLVTGNLKHFPEGARGEVRVVSPGPYLAGLIKC